MKKNKKPCVLVAMSGGVDSSVAALLMKQKGYEVIGVFMKNWSDSKNESGECNWKEERRIAIKIASKLNIPLITLDFEKQYRKEVIEKMFKLYKIGVTPNPDIDCNQKIKFPFLWRTAKKLKADFIVTGHHARLKKTKNGFELLRAKDERKDQSYFLYKLNQNDLKHTIFPIGNLTKAQVREIAKKYGFENFNKKSTVGICFIGKIKLKDFLKKKIKPKQGKILDPDGKQIGTHDGIYYYTIGQRLGPRLGIQINRGKKVQKRWYVAKKNAKENEIIAAPEGHPLNFKEEFFVKNLHWVNKKPRKKKIKVLTRIRQVGELLPSIIEINKNKVNVILKNPITGVSDGQAAVFYLGKRVLGGGVIEFK